MSPIDRTDTHEQAATAVGEVNTLTTETLTIDGSFAAALAFPLHAGARVYVFIASDLDDHVGAFDSVLAELDAAESRLQKISKSAQGAKRA